MLVSRDAIREQFSLLGVKATDASLDKCVELCASYSVSAEALVDTWISFTLSFLKGADPSPESLALMERRELQQHQQIQQQQHGVATPSLVIYSRRRGQDDDPDDDQDQIVQLYSTTPKAKNTSELTTPERRNLSKLRSPRPAFSPASFSPSTATPSTNYSSRTNSGDVVCSFPSSSYVGDWTSRTGASPSVAPLCEYSASELMGDALRRRAAVLDDLLDEFCDVYRRSRGLEELADPTLRILEEQWAVGRIACDDAGRLNAASVLLESARSVAGGKTVRLDLRLLGGYSLFPGQVVAVCGTNPSGSSFLVTQLVTDFQPLFPFTPFLEPELEAAAADPRTRLGLPESDGPLQIVVAAGPYTQTDTMLYQPLQDLLEYLERHKPHVVVLCGPFVDVRHPHVEGGSLAETFDEVFERILEGVFASLGGRTQVVLVPSGRDAHHYPLYPTPPFVPTRRYPGLHFVPDPCLLDVAGVRVGVTSVDVLMHLGKEELSFPPQSPDRLGRLAGHVLSQGCFYPLSPPSEEVDLDPASWRDGCGLSRRPHLLLLPSDLRFFVKEVAGCVVVNPGRLSKGLAGGTMARVEVPAFSAHENFSQVVRAQILRI